MLSSSQSRLPHLKAALNDLTKLQADITKDNIHGNSVLPLPISVSAVLSDVPALVALIQKANGTAAASTATAAPPASEVASTARPSVVLPTASAAGPASTFSGVALPASTAAATPAHAAVPPAQISTTDQRAVAAAAAAASALHSPVPSPAAVASLASSAAPQASAADLALLASNEVISEPGAPTTALSAAIADMLGSSMTGTPKRLQRIVSQCAAHKVGYIFAEPVTEAIAPGYSKIVAHPMDLSTMRERITGGDIGSWTGLADALCLMCRNALVYNPPASEVHAATLAFFDHALRLVQDGSGGKDFGRSEEAAGTRAALVQQVLAEAAAVKASLGLQDAEAEAAAGSAAGGDDAARRGGVKRRGSVAAAKQGPGEGPRSAKRPRR